MDDQPRGSAALALASGFLAAALVIVFVLVFLGGVK